MYESGIITGLDYLIKHLISNLSSDFLYNYTIDSLTEYVRRELGFRKGTDDNYRSGDI